MTNTKGKEDRLRSRLLVFFLGIPGLLVVIWLGGWVYTLFVAAVVFLGLHEYVALLRRGNLTPRPTPVYLAALAILIIIIYHAGLFGHNQSVDSLGLHILAVMLILVMVLQSIEVLSPTDTAWMNLSTNTVGVIWIAGFGGCFILVRLAEFPAMNTSADLALRLTLSLYITIWVCDTLAYLLGRFYGKRKILPRVSPKKTVVGTISGLFGALLIMLVLGLASYLPREAFSLWHLIVFGLIVGVGGQMGDFVESRLKRDFNVKDSGSLLPGHGGVLDRFDSPLFVMPLAYLFLRLVVLR